MSADERSRAADPPDPASGAAAAQAGGSVGGDTTLNPPAAGDPTATVIEVEVRYAETDQMGVVHHANYPVWFEIARTRLCSASGWHYADIERLGYLLMVSGLEISYRRPARYGDTVEVACRVVRNGSRGVSFGYVVSRDGRRLATGTTHHIWVETATGKPCRTPEPLREPFERLAGGDD